MHNFILTRILEDVLVSHRSSFARTGMVKLPFPICHRKTQFHSYQWKKGRQVALIFTTCFFISEVFLLNLVSLLIAAGQIPQPPEHR